MKNNYKLFTLLVLMFPLAGQAQQETNVDLQPHRWYVGVQGGVPFGVSTFNSFSETQTRYGYNFGALMGYRVSLLLSVEFSAMFGNVGLGANKCCTDYFLGVDGMRYVSPVAGVSSYSYSDIYSSVFMQQYGLRLNVDMLQIVRPEYNKRWSVLLSPTIYGVGSKATIKTKGTDTKVHKADGAFQFGAGGDLAVGYRITERLGVRLMSGVNFMMGKPFDGVPGGDHNDNFVWNNSIALTWSFGRGRKAKDQQVKNQTCVTTMMTQKKPEQVKKSPMETNETMKLQQAESIVVAEEPKEQPQRQSQILNQPDSVVMSFYAENTDFIWLYNDNDQDAKEVTEWLNANRNNPAGFIIEVHSYCKDGSEGARVQASHVKSHFILSDNLKESDFRTTLYPDSSSEGQNEVVLILKTNL